MSGRTDANRHPFGIVVRRRLAQPPATVFAAFADPAMLPRWWAPPSCPIVESSLDFRPGGVWLYRLDSAAAEPEIWSRAVFDEIDADRRIVFTETSSNAVGEVTPERAPARTTVEFAPDAGGTLLTVDVRYVSEDETVRAFGRGVERGLTEALDALERLLTNTRGTR